MGCLTSTAKAKLKKAFKAKKLAPQTLVNKTSAERRAIFEPIIGKEAAKSLNENFEKKLTLKHRKQALINWAKQSIKETKVRADAITKINNLESILKPEQEEMFLEDLAALKLGYGVTYEEAAKVAELAREAKTLKDKIGKDDKQASEARLKYGLSVVEYARYVDALKQTNAKTPLTEKLIEILKNPLGSLGKGILESAGFTKSILSSMDNSALGRQGFMTLITEPKIWAKNAVLSFKDMYEVLKGKDVEALIIADIVSRDNFLNGLYKKEGLSVATQEEEFPTSLPEKIPVLGRLFKASQDAYTGFLHRTRADLFDKYVDIAKKLGQDIEGLGTVINSGTGRGSFGKRNENVVNALNKLFFSPRNAKAIVDVLTLHIGNKKLSPAAKKLARKQLGSLVVWGAMMMGLLRHLFGEDAVELDPTSSDFGKLRVGNTRFSILAQYPSYITLVARLATGQYKSSMTGKKKSLTSGGFGSFSKWDMLTNFIEGKLAPSASFFKKLWTESGMFSEPSESSKAVLDFLSDGDLDNRTIGLILDTLTPLPVQNAVEVLEEEGEMSPTAMAAIVADFFGVGTNTYSKRRKK